MEISFTESGTYDTTFLFMQQGAKRMFGLFTRPVAFLLSRLMAFAYFIAHAPKAFWPLLNGDELAAMFSFVFLCLAFAGGGDLSTDKTRSSKHT